MQNKNQKEWAFAYHSIINVITNSSTEMFATATASTIADINELVNKVLASAGSLMVASDLFSIRLYMESYEEVFTAKDGKTYTINQFEEKFGTDYNAVDGEWDEKEVRDYENVKFNHEHDRVYVEIIQKQGGEDISGLISNLFELKEYSC